MYRTPPLIALLLIAWSGLGHAHAPKLQDWGMVRQLGRAYLVEQATREDAEVQADAEIGPVDTRLRLTQCAEPVFFLPPGTRTFGNGSLGVRCEAPERWVIYLTFTLALRGPALVTTAPLAARQAVSARDVEVRLVAYESPPGEYLRRLEDLEGVISTRALGAGQPLTKDRVMRQPTVRAGQRVKVLLQGAGFLVTQEGVALNAATPGETVRVRTSAGKILQGLATSEGQVRMGP